MPSGRVRQKLHGFALRCVVIASILALLAGVCVVRLVQLQLVEAHALAVRADDSRTLKLVSHAQRGRILDVNGQVLAHSVERYTIIADPKTISQFEPVSCDSRRARRLGWCHSLNGHDVNAKGPAAVARILAPVLNLNPVELGARLVGKSRYAIIARNVTPATKRAIEDLHLQGYIYHEISSQRLYTSGTTLGSILGGVDNKNIGVSGIEKMQNDLLTGKDGYRVYQRGLGGEEIPGTQTDEQRAVNGNDVKLTIDSSIDWYLKKVLTEGAKQFSAKWAIGMVQEVGTGRILALEDSDQVQAGSDEAKLNVARVVSQVFEPGSIGKIFASTAMLQLGLRHMSDQFTVPYNITVNHENFHDAINHSASNWTLSGIIAHSSNVGMILAGKDLTAKQRFEFLQKFGIGQPTGLGLPGESKGLLHDVSKWDRRTENTVLFGQGYAANIMQISNAIATIANGGVRLPLSIIDSVTDAQGHSTSKVASPDQGVRVVDDRVAKDELNAMESVAESYSRLVRIPGYRVAGKSGTAEVADEYGRLTGIIADWSGVVPADNPRFVITIALRDPHGIYGTVAAGPLFKQVGEFLMQKYQIPPSQPRTDAIPISW